MLSVKQYQDTCRTVLNMPVNNMADVARIGDAAFRAVNAVSQASSSFNNLNPDQRNKMAAMQKAMSSVSGEAYRLRPRTSLMASGDYVKHPGADEKDAVRAMTAAVLSAKSVVG